MEENMDWQKPKLIVLVRARPEEAILQVCKKNGAPHGGPHGVLQLCANSGSICFYCHEQISS